jgi:glycosyltransferase involved in cell wall biosynthesis
VVKRQVDVSVVTPAIPPRAHHLEAAKLSVRRQTVEVAEHIIVFDFDKNGAAVCRDQALEKATTEWVAFLDDDDEFYPQHVERLLDTAIETGADLVYPWFNVHGGTDPFPFFEGQPWDNDNIHQVPVTFLVKTQLAKDVGGFNGGWTDLDASDEHGNRMGEDLHFIHKIVAAGGKIVHLNERTWGWHHWAGNTSGLPSRW